MIPIRRGREPRDLASIRSAELNLLRQLSRPPRSDEIDGYRVVAEELWRAQRYKCCYCEMKLPVAYNDVEHYRPKASANRAPGCPEGHGYWWLAFTWANLLFACPACNRTGKNDRFPLRSGSVPLAPENVPPGRERPLLLNPADSRRNPVAHIEFAKGAFRGSTVARWWARPRWGSVLGAWTIDVCGLNRGELVELRDDYCESIVSVRVRPLIAAVQAKQQTRVVDAFGAAMMLLAPRMPFVGFAYDALRALVPDLLLAPWGVAWPKPEDVGR